MVKRIDGVGWSSGKVDFSDELWRIRLILDEDSGECNCMWPVDGQGRDFKGDKVPPCPKHRPKCTCKMPSFSWDRKTSFPAELNPDCPVHGFECDDCAHIDGKRVTTNQYCPSHGSKGNHPKPDKECLGGVHAFLVSGKSCECGEEKHEYLFLRSPKALKGKKPSERIKEIAIKKHDPPKYTMSDAIMDYLDERDKKQ